MDRLSKSFAAKVIIYILMLICMMTTVSTGMAVAVNSSNSWYSKPEAIAKQDIYDNVAFFAGISIADYACYSDDGIHTGLELLKQDNNHTIIKGEDTATEFGYSLYVVESEEVGDKNTEKWIPVKEVNPQLKKQEDVYTANVEDGTSKQIKLDIYLGDIENGGVPDEVGFLYSLYQNLYKYRIMAAAAAVIGAIVSLALLILLLCLVGKNQKKRNFINKIPMDFLSAAAFMVLVGAVAVVYSMGFSSIKYMKLMIIVAAATVLAAVLITTGVLLIFAIQVKAGKWWQNTLIYKVWILLKKVLLKLKKALMGLLGIFKRVNMVWKTGLIVLAGIIINFVMMIQAISSYGSGGVMFFWFIGAVLTAALVIYVALCMKKLQEGGKKLADGDMGYKIDTKGLYLDLKEHAENLNDIGNGMAKAVEERMRSEHFKTELITNVSHDIKTPITSIINYVDFLKQEEIQNEKAKEYIEVLDRQSQRLKKLTEDLVEASKAATGNVNIELAPCDAGVMMTQVMGEYKAKAENEDLNIIMKIPDENVNIMADGRSLWRVFDNLLNNICKYSQPGTRVYQSLETKDGKAVITYKNTSKYELNISGDELTERFIRGDSSRHTEGSGLGLSIAKNLIELQGGSFDIYIDGDLFKVIIEFKLMS